MGFFTNLRADRLGVYGAPPDASPTLDALAREGIVFADAVSQASWTMPSSMPLVRMASMVSRASSRGEEISISTYHGCRPSSGARLVLRASRGYRLSPSSRASE